MGKPRIAAITLAVLCLMLLGAGAFENHYAHANGDDWIDLFNGRDLDNWTVKIRGYPPGKNFADTFRVQGGLLTVSYDGYEDFDNRFGHIFYEHAFSHYRLKLEYRFVGEQAAGGQGWAKKNSGVMLHSQAPETMPAAQDFPISLEAQFLGGLGDGHARPTGNLCTPGTDVHINGEFLRQHCIASSSPTFDGDQWVEIEVLVLGGERIVHLVKGEAVMAYTDMTYGSGAVSGHPREAKPDGATLAGGFIALQSESHPIQFRHIRLLDLKGCMRPGDKNFREYFVESAPERCASSD